MAAHISNWICNCVKYSKLLMHKSSFAQNILWKTSLVLNKSFELIFIFWRSLRLRPEPYTEINAPRKAFAFWACRLLPSEFTQVFKVICCYRCNYLFIHNWQIYICINGKLKNLALRNVNVNSFIKAITWWHI